jgi:hypothetical protein
MEKQNSSSRRFHPFSVKRSSTLDSSVKVITIVGLIILGIVLDLGGKLALLRCIGTCH